MQTYRVEFEGKGDFERGKTTKVLARSHDEAMRQAAEMLGVDPTTDCLVAPLGNPPEIHIYIRTVAAPRAISGAFFVRCEPKLSDPKQIRRATAKIAKAIIAAVRAVPEAGNVQVYTYGRVLRKVDE